MSIYDPFQCVLYKFTKHCSRMGIASKMEDEYPMGYWIYDHCKIPAITGMQSYKIERLTITFNHVENIDITYNTRKQRIHVQSYLSGTPNGPPINFDGVDLDMLADYVQDDIYQKQGHYEKIRNSTLTSILCFQRLGILRDVAVLLGKYVYQLKWEWFKK